MATKKKKSLSKKRKSLPIKRKENSKKVKIVRKPLKGSSVKRKKLSKVTKAKGKFLTNIDKIRKDVKEAAENLDSNFKVSQRKSYVEARLIFDGDPTLMKNIIRDIQTSKKFLPKGKRARFQITFIPDEDLKELNYFKRNKMTTALIDYKDLMGRYIKMVDTTKERDWTFKKMFVGIVIDEGGNK